METKEETLLDVIRGPGITEPIDALRQLAALRFPDEQHPELHLINDPDPLVACVAISSLEGADAEWATQPLLDVLWSHEHEYAKAYAAKSLASLKGFIPKGVQLQMALEAATQAGDRDVLAAVARTIGDLRVWELLPTLKRLSFHGDGLVRHRADRAIMKLIPWHIDSLELAKRYLDGNEIAAEALSSEESLRVRKRFGYILGGRFGPPLTNETLDELVDANEPPRSKLRTFLWDAIPASFMAGDWSLSDALKRYGGHVYIMFESRDVPVFRTLYSNLINKRMTDTDLYVLPDDESWLFVITHEEEFGPYFIPLREPE